VAALPPQGGGSGSTTLPCRPLWRRNSSSQAPAKSFARTGSLISSRRDAQPMTWRQRRSSSESPGYDRGSGGGGGSALRRRNRAAA
jgi:hypothetical protein